MAQTGQKDTCGEVMDYKMIVLDLDGTLTNRDVYKRQRHGIAGS